MTLGNREMEQGAKVAKWSLEPPNCANCPSWQAVHGASHIGRCVAPGLRHDWMTEARYVCAGHPYLASRDSALHGDS